MGKNKIIYGGNVLIDLTADTVSADKLLSGITAHDKSGEIIEGACTYDSDTQDATVAVAEMLSGKTAYARGEKLVGVLDSAMNSTDYMEALSTAEEIKGVG